MSKLLNASDFVLFRFNGNGWSSHLKGEVSIDLQPKNLSGVEKQLKFRLPRYELFLLQNLIYITTSPISS